MIDENGIQRRTGRTTRACQRVVRQIVGNVVEQTIVWRIPQYSWTQHIVPMLARQLDEVGASISKESMRTRRLLIRHGNNVHRLIFLVPDVHGDEPLRGSHPVWWVYDEGEFSDYDYVARLQRAALEDIRRHE